ncbi:clathrin associated protein complex [Salix suchowensis]|nr:clathrin associated protein complex [Salix suchowensis]
MGTYQHGIGKIASRYSAVLATWQDLLGRWKHPSQIAVRLIPVEHGRFIAVAQASCSMSKVFRFDCSQMGVRSDSKWPGPEPERGHITAAAEPTVCREDCASDFRVAMVYHNLKDRGRRTRSDTARICSNTSFLSRRGLVCATQQHRKVTYIHMLGSPAHFGQIECLKLVASPRFSDKRLGYLGIMLLLDENQETLMLVTNSLKKYRSDMNHSNMYAVGLALCTFANIASEEMSRDLVNEIEKLLGSSNAYIRKKIRNSLPLCTALIKKVPELTDHFVEKSKNLLTDRNHGVLLTAITLITEMCQISPLFWMHSETGDERASETMNDILAQVATNTDSTKNVGNSILYETVLTVLEIEADTGLRVMAINILGKFLGNRDNNIRYVALNTLNKVVSMDTSAVQRHRNIILDCLRDGDISIRRRALELSYALINEQNVRELLAFLEVADDEFKLGMTTQISLAAEKFAPNKRWHIDTVLRVLKLAGNFVREEILSAFIRLVAHTQSYRLTRRQNYTRLSKRIFRRSR